MSAHASVASDHSVANESGDDIRVMLRESVRAFAVQNSGVERMRRLRDSDFGYDPVLWGEMGQAGWLGLRLPEAFGGSELGLAEQCVIAEELGADLAPEPYGAATLAAMAIANGGNDGLKQRLLPSFAAGKLVAAFACQETVNTLGSADIATALVQNGGGYRLSGRKQFVIAAKHAGGFVVTATTPSGPVLCWVDSGAAGLSVSSAAALDGSHLSTVSFESVSLDQSDIIAGASATSGILQAILDEALLVASAELIGIARTALDRTLAYVRQRVQFGKPIGSFQVLQHRLVDFWMQHELARACLGQALGVFASTADPQMRARAASATKARASAMAVLVGRQSIQLHGAIGYADEHDIGLYLKRAIVRSSWLGTAALHRKRFASFPAQTDQ